MNLMDLHTFAMVAETGTISAAAKRLNVPKSTVSRRVRRLEESIGHELLRRSSRSIALTQNGRVLYERSAPALQEINAVVCSLLEKSPEPKGRLKVTTVSGFGHSAHFLDALKQFGERYPSLAVELEVTTRLVDFVEEGFDVGIRLHQGPLSGDASLMTRKLFSFGRGFYASPEYLQSRRAPESIEELSEHHVLGHAIADVRENAWVMDGTNTRLFFRLPSNTRLFNDTTAMERSAVLGAGIAILPTINASSHMEAGTLIRVLPELKQSPATASLVWSSSRHLAPRIRAFIDFMVEHFRDF